MGSGYDGHVDPGGSPARRRLEAVDGTTVEITKLSVGGMDNNVYVVRGGGGDDGSPDTVLIDAADEPRRILDALGDARVGAIVTTHRHADHWQALGAVAEATGAPVLAGVEDADAIGHRVDRRLHHGDEVRLGALALSVLHTPGHTPGSVCLDLRTRGEWSHHLFTGDTLFPGGHGRTATPEDHERIMDGLEQKVFGRLPDDTWVYPGHGDDTTLGAERPHLQEWRRRGW